MSWIMSGRWAVGTLPISFTFLGLEMLVYHRPARVATELVIFMAVIKTT